MDSIIQKSLKYKNLLLLLLKFPTREFTMLELAKEANVSYATTWRLIQELDKVGIVLTKRIGNAVVCRLNVASPYIMELKKSLFAVSPHKKASLEFAKLVKKLPRVKEVVLFGSVARGREKPESDVDVAIIASKKRGLEKKINRICSAILESARIKVVPLLLTESELEENKSFKKEIEKGVVL